MRIGLLLFLLSTVALAQDDLQDVLQELFGKGLNAFNKGQYPEAVELYSRAIALDSISTNVRFNRAAAYMRMGRYGEAKDDLDRILAVRPELLNARAGRDGFACACNGRRNDGDQTRQHLPQGIPLPRTCPSHAWHGSTRCVCRPA